MNFKKTISSNAFTLVEMIAVIGVIALLSVLSIPAYNSINKAANIKAAVNEVESATYMARQQAITRRQRVGFGIPYRITGNNPFIKSNMLNRSYVLFTEEVGGVSQAATILGKVGVLPKGTYFLPSSLNTITTDFVDSNGKKIAKIHSFRFAPIGSVYFYDLSTTKGKPFTIQIGEGVVDEKGVPTAYTTNNVRTLQINSYTGRCLEIN